MDTGVPLGVILYHKHDQVQQGQVQSPEPGLEQSLYQYRLKKEWKKSSPV